MIVIAEPDPRWAEMYEATQARLVAATGGRFVAIEHIGSTAVPGLAAKPILDLLAAIASRDALDEVVAGLAPLGYEYLPRVPGDVDVAYFRRFEAGVRTHQIHVVLADAFATDDRLAFRDRLRADPALAAAYAALKRELAARLGHDRLAYTDAKTDFILAALGRAPVC